MRILIANDHVMVREGLRLILNSQPDMEVIAEADNTQQAWKLTREMLPDVVLLDTSMANFNGAFSALQAMERIVALSSKVRVVALSTYQDESRVRQVLVAGASGYVLKNARSQELVQSMREVHKGNVYLHPLVAGQVVGGYLNQPKKPVERDGLSPRQMEVLLQVAWGHTNKAIAENLHLSVKTVEGHKTQIGTKLGLTTRAKTMLYAMQHGWMNEA